MRYVEDMEKATLAEFDKEEAEWRETAERQVSNLCEIEDPLPTPEELVVIPRYVGDGRLPAFKEGQDHGAVDDDQLKVFSEATVRKAADVRHTQQRYEPAPIDNPRLAVFYPTRQATNMVKA